MTTSDFDQRRAEILRRIGSAVRDLSTLYAEYPDRAIPSLDEPVGVVCVTAGDAEESVVLHNVYPLSTQHSEWSPGDEGMQWGPVVYCVLGLSKDGLPIH